MENDIVLMLRKEAEELEQKGYSGWASTMLEAAEIIENLKAAQHSVQADVCREGGEHEWCVDWDKDPAMEYCAGCGKRR